jgi:D-arabinose 1-dehydrogenase-like Zn-dependent alcohol dehydrogenase
VGVGFLAGSCGYCEFCRNGDLVNCKNQEFTGIHHDGGYAEAMIAKASGLVSVPDDLTSVAAAPLLCAGLTTFSALTGDPATGEAALRFSAASGVSAMIETVPLEKAPEAYAKMIAGNARFRMVLTTDS